MKLYLTVDSNRKAFINSITFPKVGEVIEMEFWDKATDLNSVNSLYGCSTEPDQGCIMDVAFGNIFLEVEAEKKDVVKCGNYYNFRKGRVTREWVIGKDTCKEVWSLLSGGSLYDAGAEWPLDALSNEMIIEGWGRLEGEWLYRSGIMWEGITVEMKKEGLTRLSGIWVEWAKIDWDLLD